MKNINKKIKTIQIIFRIIIGIIIVVGLGFSYLIAELEDAPGFIIIGTTFTLIGATFIYVLGEIIIQMNINNELLSDIHRELITNKKQKRN